MATSGFLTRAASTLSAAVLAAHELQALIAYGGDAREALSHQGHAYLAVVTPVVGVGLAVGLTWLLLAYATLRWPRQPSRLSPHRVWLAASAALLAIYVSQELLEGWLAAGHSEGLAGAFGTGGLVVLALAGGVGALAAFMLGAVATAAALGAPVRAARPRLVAPLALEAVTATAIAPPTRGLARPQCGRAPPGAFLI